ncbi:MAG: hypothetical protein IT281_01650 [Ignavibacteria bacterium]|nr:hypothetical protein [Ignavibacteria bacterium]
MNSHLLKSDPFVEDEQLISSFGKWIKTISIMNFVQAVTLFVLSFLLFFIRRTTGTDPHMVSGAFDGTTQLTYFVSVNITAMLFALMGYYLYMFSHDDIEGDTVNRFALDYFKLAGIISVLFFAVILWGIYYFAL